MDVYYQENGNILLDTSTPGTYEYRCATMCGSGHQEMKGVVIVEWRYKKTNKEMFGEIIQLLKTSKKLLYSVYNPKKPDR